MSCDEFSLSRSKHFRMDACQMVSNARLYLKTIRLHAQRAGKGNRQMTDSKVVQPKHSNALVSHYNGEPR